MKNIQDCNNCGWNEVKKDGRCTEDTCLRPDKTECEETVVIRHKHWKPINNEIVIRAAEKNLYKRLILDAYQKNDINKLHNIIVMLLDSIR